MKYFTDEIEYPKPTEDILPLGVMWEYISSTFLNGWINYVDPLSVKVLLRYSNIPDKPDVKLHTEILVQEFNESPPFHVYLAELDDDILILAREKETVERDNRHYWFFWFDCDVSDCCIGRFETTDTEEEVLQEFERYAQELADEYKTSYLDLKLRPVTGWIKF